MELSLESLGLTVEQLRQMVVDKLCDRLATSFEVDTETGQECPVDSPLVSQMTRRLQERLREQVDASVERLAGECVLPKVVEMVEKACLTKTNQWGEKVAETVTFREYLVARFEKWLEEKVDYEGKTKTGYNEGRQTRIAWAIDKHLQYTLQHLIERTLQEAGTAVVSGVVETCKTQLELAAKKLKAEVKL